jgi:nitrous oxide reductase
MKKNIANGLVVALFAAAISASGPAAAVNLGSCGPANAGEIQSFSHYHYLGWLKSYYEFQCSGIQWYTIKQLECDMYGHCIDIS